MRVQRTILAAVGSATLAITSGAVAYAQDPIGGNGGAGAAAGNGGAAGAATVVNSNAVTCGDQCKSPTKATASIRGTSNGGKGGPGGHGGRGGNGFNRF